jgi:hypothetical protein
MSQVGCNVHHSCPCTRPDESCLGRYVVARTVVVAAGWRRVSAQLIAILVEGDIVVRFASSRYVFRTSSCPHVRPEKDRRISL